jgi:hypothetical protein
LAAILSPNFYGHYVTLPTRETPVEDAIALNTKLFPFFKDCLGAVDGTHITATPPATNIVCYRDRKGGISQNVLIGTTFDMRVCYCMAGWEGSAAEGRIYESAQAHNFTIPSGMYYLADAGFLNCMSLLVPYRGVQYHLCEWKEACNRYVKLHHNYIP